MAETIIGGLSGSQNYLVVNSDGSINVSGTLSANVTSVYITSGANIQLGSAWTNIGSVIVTNPSAVGSIGIQTISGTINQGTTPWAISGVMNMGSYYEYATYRAYTNGNMDQGGSSWFMLWNSGPNSADIVRINKISISPTLLSVSQAVGTISTNKTTFPNFGQTGSITSIDQTSDSAISSNIKIMSMGSIALGSIIDYFGYILGSQVGWKTDIYNYSNNSIHPITLRANEGIVVKNTVVGGTGSINIICEFTTNT